VVVPSVLKPRSGSGTEVPHSKLAAAPKSLECGRFSAALTSPASAARHTNLPAYSRAILQGCSGLVSALKRRAFG